MKQAGRAGRYIDQPTGYKAFIPSSLPPDPAIEIKELLLPLEQATLSLGRLDGITTLLPNPDLFVAMFVKYEALLSSQIEGTESSLGEVIKFEIDPQGIEKPLDVKEVVNYVNAMDYGLKRLAELPVSLRLIREIHGKLLDGVRGGQQSLGEFRTSQNWIGPKGSTIATASFIPPPVYEMNQALDNFEKFLHEGRTSFPILILCGLAHAQFETIHPFLDGNGRLGRLLITFLLCEQKVMKQPLLYLSHYLKAHHAEYYDRLMAVRNDGDWESWLQFFLKGVYEVSEASTSTAKAILALQAQHEALVARVIKDGIGIQFLNTLFEQPIVTIKLVQEKMGCTFYKAQKLVEAFLDLHVLTEMHDRKKRNKQYRYEQYLKLFENQVPS